MNTTGKILTAFAVGAAAGAILGILFAPDKGSETRNKIREQGRKFADSISERINKVKQSAGGLRQDLKKVVEDSVNNLQEA